MKYTLENLTKICCDILGENCVMSTGITRAVDMVVVEMFIERYDERDDEEKEIIQIIRRAVIDLHKTDGYFKFDDN